MIEVIMVLAGTLLLITAGGRKPALVPVRTRKR